MKTFVAVLRDLVLLLARVVLGGAAVLHGWRRWQLEGIEAQVQAFTAAGVPQPEAAAWAVTMLELVGGVLLVFGVLTPALALLFAVEAALSIVWMSGGNGPFVAEGGYEYAAMTGALALLLTVFGAGRASVDRLFHRPDGEDDELRYDETRPA